MKNYLTNTENDCYEPHHWLHEVAQPVWFRTNDHKSLFGMQPWYGSAEEDEGAWGPSQGTCLTVTR